MRKIGVIIGSTEIHGGGQRVVRDRGKRIQLLDAHGVKCGEIGGTLVTVVGKLHVIEREVLPKSRALVGNQRGKLFVVQGCTIREAALALPLEKDLSLKLQGHEGMNERVVKAAKRYCHRGGITKLGCKLCGHQLTNTSTARCHHDKSYGRINIAQKLLAKEPADCGKFACSILQRQLPAPIGIDDVGLRLTALLLMLKGILARLRKQAQRLVLIIPLLGRPIKAGGEIMLCIGLTADQPHVTHQHVL